MITLGLLSAPAERPRTLLRRSLIHILPLAAFVVSAPLFVACIPKPLAEVDYVIAGCASAFIAMTVALFLITRQQMKDFTAGSREGHAGKSGVRTVVVRPARSSTSSRAAASS